MRDRDFQFVLPCYDTHASILQQHRSALTHPTRYALLNPEAYKVSSSKALTYTHARALNIPLPDQIHAYTNDDLERAIEAFPFPLVLKPVGSIDAATPAARQNVRKAATPHQARGIFSHMNRGHGVLVQRNFVGPGAGVEFLAHEGRILALFQHQRVHEPMQGGQSSYRRSVPLHPEMAAAAERFAASLNWSGPGMLEFKINPTTGEFVLIEVNGRLWGSLALTIAAGLDIPRYLYELWTSASPKIPTTYRPNIHCRNWQLDARWLTHNSHADPTDPNLLHIPLRHQLAELANILTGRERSDTLALDDLAPARAEVNAILREHLRPRWMFTRPARRRQFTAAAKAAKQANSILFLCLGNICRSPFAELAAANRNREKLTISSAGVLPLANRTSPETALTAAAPFAIDLSPHRSRIVDSQLAANFDAIFVFDRWHEAELLALVPEARPKVQFLGALNPDGPLEIADPWGRSPAEFERIYRTIDGLVQRLFTLRESSTH